MAATSRFAALWILGFAVLSWILVGIDLRAAEPSTSPEKPPAPSPPPEQKLEEIQRTLKDLLQQVEALRSAPAQAAAARAAAPATPPAANAAVTLPDSWLQLLRWRCIGPANMGGRIVDLAVNEPDSSMFWSATASGGLLKG